MRAERDDGGSLPWFVERELRQYLRCGVLAHGFARVRCDAFLAARGARETVRQLEMTLALG
jgi:hypothetical protein